MTKLLFQADKGPGPRVREPGGCTCLRSEEGSALRELCEWQVDRLRLEKDGAGRPSSFLTAPSQGSHSAALVMFLPPCPSLPSSGKHLEGNASAVLAFTDVPPLVMGVHGRNKTI